MKKIIYIFTIIFFTLTSCEKNVEVLHKNNILTFDSQYKSKKDVQFEKLTIGLANVTNDDQFLKILVNSIESPEDGNSEEILLSKFNQKTINENSEPIKIGKYLAKCLKNKSINNRLKTRSENIDYEHFIDSLITIYPNLVISIPVNIEKISMGIKPHILYIPEEFKDCEYDSIQAINPLGEIEMLSLKEEPKFPVIVIKMQEGVAGESLKNDIKQKSKDENTDIVLTTTTNDAGVNITWIKDNEIQSYKLYRYRRTVLNGTDNENFEFIRSFTNNDNSNYLDFVQYSTIPKNTYYSLYKMEVTYNSGYSGIFYSTSNDILSNVRMDNVESLGNKIIKIDWTKISNDKLIGYNIYRTSSVTSEKNSSNNVWENGWVLCNNTILAPHLASYNDYDPNKITGKAYFYRVLPRTYSKEQDWNFIASNNQEAAKYVKVAICSDRSDNFQLMATHIKTRKISELESWILGRPEFDFAVYGYTSLDSTFTSKNPKKIGEFSLRDIKSSKYDEGFVINKTMLLKWENDLNMEIISVVGVEKDNDAGSWDAVAFTLKDIGVELIQRVVKVKSGVDISILTDKLKFRAGDRYAGGAYIIHSGKENVTLNLDQGRGTDGQLPRGGVQIRISNTTSNAVWQSSWNNDIIQVQDDSSY
ncbi:MAG: hypothetical protein EOM47_03285 [Bacteroidia bacterium]|nr:hypothetical protein [Bacteroidia bacterium]